MSEGFSLKDHLFNAETTAQLAREFAEAVPGFDRDRFERAALDGFPERELMARLEWLADCIEAQLPGDFLKMADLLEAAMPPPLSPVLSDNDFGHFIHAVSGILAVRHGLENHRDRSLALIHAATQRFSMEFYIRAFLNRWPEETLSALRSWAKDDNYHVRRLVSEGTRPKLPWARAIQLTPEQTFPLLDELHADPTRYVTRSVANHLNDLSKIVPDQVVQRLADWQTLKKQSAKELDWMTRHALRTLVKSGHAGALLLLGFRSDVAFKVSLNLPDQPVNIGEALNFTATVQSAEPTPVLVDYRITFARPGGKTGQKVFKLKQGRCGPDNPLHLAKSHKLKAAASTFTWHPGPHVLTLQVNGIDCASVGFDVASPAG